ncbi:MAG: GNAT family N-acetyltransferase [Capsulimonas sp.]|uniref:GNAT family N-acetyltransferase n=1 Tax=Capsulimonas sp. TaxID=2494211 RepID=UPI0032634665
MLSITPFPGIETPRLSLRETRFDDATDIFRILSQPEVVRHYNIGPLADVDEARAIVTRRRQSHLQGTRIRWAIALKENDQVIGSCGYVNPDSQSRQAEIGYELDTAYWGKGLMREALAAMLGFGFARIGLHRIEALVVPENASSRRLLATLGFQQEGLLRERGFWKDAFHDLALYSLLDRDWADSANKDMI